MRVGKTAGGHRDAIAACIQQHSPESPVVAGGQFADGARVGILDAHIGA
jgi:hypothetical protein